MIFAAEDDSAIMVIQFLQQWGSECNLRIIDNYISGIHNRRLL
jgi:hypothetical protein